MRRRRCMLVLFYTTFVKITTQNREEMVNRGAKCGTIAKEVIRGGGQYNWNDNAPVIADFCENF